MNDGLRYGLILVVIGYLLTLTPTSTLAESCPTQKSFGDTSPNSLTLRSVDGVRTINFENVYVVIGSTRSDLDVWFPPFGEEGSSPDELHQWGLEINTFSERLWKNRNSNTFEAEIKTYHPGTIGKFNCFSFPRKPGPGFGKSGDITIDAFTTGHEGGFFSSARPPQLKGQFKSSPFQFRGNHANNVSSGGYEVTINTNNIVEVEDRPLGKGNECRSDGDFYPLNKGYIVYNPQLDTLNFSMVGDKCQTSYRLLDFPGKPGLHKGQVSFGTAKLYLVDKLSENYIKGEIRVVKEENFPGMENITIEKARSLGKAVAKFNVDNLIRHPKLEPLLIPSEK
ncbi:MAG: hypothetical protein ABEK50_06515 [bacterium]